MLEEVLKESRELNIEKGKFGILVYQSSRARAKEIERELDDYFSSEHFKALRAWLRRKLFPLLCYGTADIDCISKVYLQRSGGAEAATMILNQNYKRLLSEKSSQIKVRPGLLLRFILDISTVQRSQGFMLDLKEKSICDLDALIKLYEFYQSQTGKDYSILSKLAGAALKNSKN